MKKINLTYIGVISLILFASFTRIIPHMPNFTPIGAMALFGGAYLKNKNHAFLIPILSLWISDLIINNFIFSYYNDFTWFYPGFFMAIWLIFCNYFNWICFLKKNQFKKCFYHFIKFEFVVFCDY
jgi:hypothetical protein